MLVFTLSHRFDNPAARLVFGALRCTVTDPDQITTSAIGTASYYQYVDYFFKGAPFVRPGLYSFKWQGQRSNGEWVDITDGEYVVKGPSLVVAIMENRFENWKHIALIAALRVKITNTTGAMIRLRSIGFTCDSEGMPGWDATVSNDERLEVERELHARRERQHYGIPLRSHATVPAGESISGWIVEAVARNPKGGSPRCTVVIEDDLRDKYRASLDKREPKTYGLASIADRG